MLSLDELSKKVKEIFAAENFTGTPSGLYEPIEYTLADGGKRIRPTMLLASTQMFGGNISSATDAAIAMETFHNFTLLHDDLMDKSPLRRGKPTVYTKWDANTAILSGDAMCDLAWRYMLRTPHPNLHAILTSFEQMCMEIYEGQQYDMEFETRDDVTISEYKEMIRLKTAVMLGTALKIGALIADAPSEAVRVIYDFGIELGLAFQLRDDLLDAYGDTTVFGKQTGSDIKDNKKTYLLLAAMQRGDERQRAELRRFFATTPDDPADKIKAVLDIYALLDIKKIVEDEIGKHNDNALSILDQIEAKESQKEPLRQLAERMLTRDK